jgi:predicted DNA-binding WGR domain protein
LRRKQRDISRREFLQTRTFADEAKAKRETERLIAEKVKKGYVEKVG